MFCELDSTSDTVQFSLSPDSSNFRITTFGHSGTYHVNHVVKFLVKRVLILNVLGFKVDIPKESDVIETLRCTSAVSFKYEIDTTYIIIRRTRCISSISDFRYKLSLMKPSIKPLGIAQKVSLRIDDTGLICFQFMIKVEDNHNCYIDFYVSSFFFPSSIRQITFYNRPLPYTL